MSLWSLLRPIEITEIPENHFLVVHPLDDAPEQKVDTTSLGAMPMTTSVKLSLMLLRGYLVVMMLFGALSRHGLGRSIWPALAVNM